jgi:hypothetical protein
MVTRGTGLQAAAKSFGYSMMIGRAIADKERLSASSGGHAR